MDTFLRTLHRVKNKPAYRLKTVMEAKDDEEENTDDEATRAPRNATRGAHQA